MKKEEIELNLELKRSIIRQNLYFSMNGNELTLI
jgi:hypothetical protein